MSKFFFIAMNIFLAFNAIPFFVLVLISAMILWVPYLDEYLSYIILLAFLINHFVKIVIFPVIYTICEKKNSKCLNFWNKLINNKDYKKEILIIAGTLDFVSLFLCCLAFESLDLLIFILMGGGVLTSYVWFFIWYKFYNTKHKQTLSNVCKSIVCIFVILSLLLIVLAYCDRVSFDDITKYDKMHKKVKNYYDINHFPEKLPSNATNYYFQFEDAFDGYNDYYVRFSADKTYIENEKNKFKGKCDKSITKEYFNNFHFSTLDKELINADELCILHKSTDKERFTSGISIYNDTNTIYYFFANY